MIAMKPSYLLGGAMIMRCRIFDGDRSGLVSTDNTTVLRLILSGWLINKLHEKIRSIDLRKV